MARVVVEHLTKLFPGQGGKAVRAVDDVSFTVEDGALLVLAGPSGCGKTTTLRILAGLEQADSGRLLIGGKEVTRLAPKDRDMAMVFQNHALYPHMSAFDNMAFGLKVRRCSKGEIQQRVGEAAALLGLNDCLERRPGELSGGQRQRVALGRALVRRPQVFLFDEPLSNLDVPMRLQMRAEISRLHRKTGATMIYVTHDQNEAMTLGDRLAVMKNGILQQVDAPLALYQHPANLFVAGFIGSPPMNLISGVLARRNGALFFEAQPGPSASPDPESLSIPLDEETASRVASHVGKPVVLGIRPENILAHRLEPDSRPRATVETLVEVVEPLGAETLLYLAAGRHSFIARIPASITPRAGQALAVAIETRYAHFFDPVTTKAIT